jgi:hypothetical protein
MNDIFFATKKKLLMMASSSGVVDVCFLDCFVCVPACAIRKRLNTRNLDVSWCCMCTLSEAKVLSKNGPTLSVGCMNPPDPPVSVFPGVLAFPEVPSISVVPPDPPIPSVPVVPPIPSVPVRSMPLLRGEETRVFLQKKKRGLCYGAEYVCEYDSDVEYIPPRKLLRSEILDVE